MPLQHQGSSLSLYLPLSLSLDYKNLTKSKKELIECVIQISFSYYEISHIPRN
jgi:hypothetical protein